MNNEKSQVEKGIDFTRTKRRTTFSHSNEERGMKPPAPLNYASNRTCPNQQRSLILIFKQKTTDINNETEISDRGSADPLRNEMRNEMRNAFGSVGGSLLFHPNIIRNEMRQVSKLNIFDFVCNLKAKPSDARMRHPSGITDREERHERNPQTRKHDDPSRRRIGSKREKRGKRFVDGRTRTAEGERL